MCRVFLVWLCQYLGSRSPEAVKKKVLELIYSWTVALPDEAKISDAYQMLKKQGKMALPFRPTQQKVSLFQLRDATGPCCFSLCPSGIIKQDPELPADKLLNLPPPRPKNAIFEDEEKSKVSQCVVLGQVSVCDWVLWFLLASVLAS